MMVPTCSICLGELNEPVSIPCGHIYCFRCLTECANGPANESLSVPCPQCRQEFQLVTPDPRTLPKKYHPFIEPHMRRVFIDVPQPSETTQDLKRQINALKKTVENLRMREDTLMRECERHVERANAYREREQEAREQLEEMERRAEEAEDRAADAEDRAEDAESRADDAEARAEDAEERFRLAEDGLRRLADLYEDLKPKYKSLKKQHRGLQADLEASRQSENTIRQELDAMMVSHRELQRRALDATAQNRTLTIRCRELGAELEIARVKDAKTEESPRSVRVRSSSTAFSDFGGSELSDSEADEKSGAPLLKAPYKTRMGDLDLSLAHGRVRIKRPLPRRRARPLSEEDELELDATRKRPRYSEPVLGNTPRRLL